MSAQQKQLRIQTGVVSRTFKEKVYLVKKKVLWFLNFVRIGTRGLRVYDDDKKSLRRKIWVSHSRKGISREIYALCLSKIAMGWAKMSREMSHFNESYLR